MSYTAVYKGEIVANIMKENGLEIGFSIFSKHHLRYLGIPLPNTIGASLDNIIGYVNGFARARAISKIKLEEKDTTTYQNIYNDLCVRDKARYLVGIYKSFIDLLNKDDISDQLMYDIKESITVLSMYDGDEEDAKHLPFYINEINRISKDLNLDWLIHFEIKEN